ncbi:ovarian cancer G-protein coupled receptor 1-like [Conger conger]|uniref:ovarian cancer G-protein coupled receptor 1-like n=1 Tax=Conger conger TaxID=82655 RepID=UPI002A5AD316|nr:ovarian cancer G-protein coupled receptor 1-like [Conger conger]
MDPSHNLTNGSISGSCTTEDLVDICMYPSAYSIFFIIGFPANCLSFYVALVLARKGNNLAVYLVNLSFSDLLYTITLPVWIQLALGYPVSDTLCSLITVIMNNSFYVGTSFLCCISVDRYLAVVFPLHYPGAHTVQVASAVSALVWCMELGLHAVLLHHQGALRSFSALRLCEEKMPLRPVDSCVALVRVTLSFLLPLLLMTFCFLKIFLAVQGSTFTQESDRRKIQFLLLLLLLTYTIAFAPFQTVMFLRGIWETDMCSFALRMRDAYMVTFATTTINSVVDPILYCLWSEAAKVEMILLVQGSWRRFRRILALQ